MISYMMSDNIAMNKEITDIETSCKMDDFYYKLQSCMLILSEVVNFRYITSRSTEENTSYIKSLYSTIQYLCKNFNIPTEGDSIKSTDSSIKVFKYLICNTNFGVQSLLSDDTAMGHLVDIQPCVSPYLLMEILWLINFDDLLAESILHFPLDLCVEIFEILPRCIDLLEFQRALKFLKLIIPNAYKKLIILKDTGSQTQNISEHAKKFAGNLQELIMQLNNERFLKLKDISKSDQYKKCGVLLKTIIQILKTCFISKSKNIEISCEMQKKYKLTFGWKPFEKLDDTLLEELLTEIDREMVNLLLKKIKEVDCNIYLNWIEYEDEERSSLSLQRSIGLEAYFFIENIKKFNNSNIQEYNHLVECLQQIAAKPDPTNFVEIFHLEDLCNGVREGKKECLISLFQRYKEWDNLALESIESSICLLNKDDCAELLKYFAMEFNDLSKQLNLEKLQSYSLFLAKALMNLEITELYEIVIEFILKFEENNNFEKIIDIANFEKFITHNPNFSTIINLRVVLYFLCLKTRATLKILLKMAIGHSDYLHVAVTLDDLMLLLPILKIQTESKSRTIIESLKNKCVQKTKDKIINHKKEHLKNKTENVTLAIKILQDICLETPKWNKKKFADLLQMLLSFCKVSEIINEIIVPLLMSDFCTVTHIQFILIELHKQITLIDKVDQEISLDLYYALEKQGLHLLQNNHISRYTIDELISLIISLLRQLCDMPQFQDVLKLSEFNYNRILLGYNFNSPANSVLKVSKNFLQSSIDQYIYKHQNELIDFSKYPINSMDDDIMRYLYLKCTKRQYLEYAREQIIAVDKKAKHTSKSDICNSIIRSTFEACLLYLEFPKVGPSDSISFLIRCLIKLLSAVNSTKKSHFSRELCQYFDKHVALWKFSIVHTSISDAYKELLKQCNESCSLTARLTSLEKFAQSCVENNENLKIYRGPHSPLAIKFLMAYEISSKIMNDSVIKEESIAKLGNYFV